MGFTPNAQQAEGLRKAKKWWNLRNKQCFEISGIAGSGKTTLVYHIIEELGLSMDDVVFCAFIGKAALALCRKGTPATTIHHLIYDVVDVPKMDGNGNTIKDPSTNRAITTPKFIRKPELAPNIKLIVVDEGAMVGSGIANDLLSFGIPMIILGDRNQLPPVFGQPTFLNFPDVSLTEPMRQSMDSPIIYLAQKAIKQQHIEIGRYSDDVFVVSKDDLTDNMLMYSDVNICHRNETRERINGHIRYDILKRPHMYPCRGDKIICRQNNWQECLNNEIYLINGLIGYVDNIELETYNKRSVKIDFRPEFLDSECFKGIELDWKYITTSFEERKNIGRSYYNKFEYAYAITCHLAQGSEYEKVTVYSEDIYDREFYRKWLYTAITRSSKSLILAI